MFLRIISTTPNIDLAIYRAKKLAKASLASQPMGVTERLLNRYLQENYNLTLKVACSKILQNARFMTNLNREIIVNIPDEELNKIAKIITYGTGAIPGSRILRNIFYL